MPARVILTVTKGEPKGKELVFDSRTVCMIGRDATCNLQVPNADENRSVSRFHCLLEINPPLARVRDCGSRNGTYVNGGIIGQRDPEQAPGARSWSEFPERELRDGDEIQVGTTILQVRVHRGPAADAARAGRDEDVRTTTLAGCA